MKDCFIICPIGGEGSEVRKKSDQLLKYVLGSVLELNGYKALRADQIPKAGLITTHIINLIIESPLVIADLSGGNPNVFYELALRHATQEPYIQIIGKGEKIPFDVGAVRTIQVDLADLDSVAKAKDDVDRQIKEFDKGYKPDSPIMVAKVAKLLQSDIGFAEQIAERLSEISDIRAESDMYCPEPYYQGSLSLQQSMLEMADGIDKINKKVWSLRDFGIISLEDIDKKLNLIISKLPNG